MTKDPLPDSAIGRPSKNREATFNQASDHADDLAIARKIQAAMIPRNLPSIEGIDMASLYMPCSLVGGDMFDVVQISENVLALLIFDVSGHGVSSTLLSALAKVCFMRHISAVKSPRVVIERVNAEIIRDVSADFYLTAFVGYLDLHDNRLTYSNAGHVNPIICRKEGTSIVELAPQGTLVGILDQGFYDEQNVFLQPGDWLVLLTDGLLRVFGDRNSAETLKRFESLVQKESAHVSPCQFIASIKSHCETQFAEENQVDDISIVAIEMLTESRKMQIKQKLGFCAEDAVYLQTLSYFEDIDRVASSVLSSMDMFGYPDEIIRKMKVALTELLVNAIHHGNAKDFSKRVFMGHQVENDHTVVSIMDEGSGFDPTIVPDPTLPENLGKDCGRGLYIVKHYVDKVEYNASCNRITITKYHPYF